MKVTSIRNLLIVLDVALVTGISSVVYRGIQEKNSRSTDARRLFETISKELSEIGAEGQSSTAKVDYGTNITGVNISGYTPVVVAPVAPKEPTPVASSKPPLESVLKLVGIEHHGSPNSKSRILVAREGPFPGKPEDALREQRYFEEGSVIEWAHGAVVKTVEVGRVLFDYDNKEVVLVPKAAPPAAGSAKTNRKVEVQPSADVNTWVAVDAQRPANIEITDVGVASLKVQGEASLEGVRWSEETLEDGQKAIRIDEVPPNSVLAKGGAQGGDVLVSLNGTRVSSRADIVAYVKRNPDLSRYEVVFLRRGIKHTRVVSVPR